MLQLFIVCDDDGLFCLNDKLRTTAMPTHKKLLINYLYIKEIKSVRYRTLFSTITDVRTQVYHGIYTYLF